MILKQGPSKVLCHGQDHFCWAMSDNASYRQNANPSLALLERVKCCGRLQEAGLSMGRDSGPVHILVSSITPLTASLCQVHSSETSQKSGPLLPWTKFPTLIGTSLLTLHISTAIPCHTSPQPTFSLQAFLSSTSSLLKTYTPLLFYNTPRSPIKPAIHIFNY